MITTFIGFSIRIWVFNGDPDNDVHTSGGSYADIGELFMNTSNGVFFVCTQSGTGIQTWQTTTNTSLVQSIIASTVLQSNWTQSNSSSQDFIKNKPTIPAAQVNSDWNSVSGVSQILNKPSIPSGQVQSDWTQSSSGAVDFIKNKPAARSQSSVSRSLNTIFQPSSTRDTLANYSVDIACSLTLVTGQAGTVYLEISLSSTFASGIQEVARGANGNTGTLTIGLALAQNVTMNLGGYIPSGYYARLRTENNTSTPTFTYRSGQEVSL